MPFLIDAHSSVFHLPEVKNWVKNTYHNKHFWNEAIVHFEVYRTFRPFMRFCVDMRISGVRAGEIARVTGKKVQTVRNTLSKAKKRLVKIIL